MQTLRIWLRGVLSTACAAGAALATWCLTGGPIRELVATARSRRSASLGWTLEHLVEDLASALLLGAVLAMATTFAIAVLETVTRDRSPRVSAACAALTPRICLRLAAACCGLGLAGPLVFGSAATAGAIGSASCHPPCGEAGLGVVGLALPDLPDGAWRPAMSDGASVDRGPQVETMGRQIVVRDGDSLWRIAERRLPADSSLGQVAALVERLYALNHRAIGEDPNLIFPEMTLLAPEGTP